MNEPRCPECGSTNVCLQKVLSGYEIYNFDSMVGGRIPVFVKNIRASDNQGFFWFRCNDCPYTDEEYGDSSDNKFMAIE